MTEQEQISALKVRAFDAEEATKAVAANFEAFAQITAKAIGFEGETLEQLVEQLQGMNSEESIDLAE